MPSIEELNHLQISLQEILSATNNFSEENRIGVGGFGKVYKGESEKYGTIAIKRCHRGESGQGDHQFKTEILLSTYKHQNIASPLGFCDEDGEKILVYKYESNRSLDRHLESRDLGWTQRLQICLDAARGLMHLHDGDGIEDSILHRDVKSANILLDENWKAKISDFGLSRRGPTQSSFVISNACGTIGYIDPEFYASGHLTQKSDVFSFGVVLFEVLCGRPAIRTIDGQYFNIWVQKHYQRKTLDQIIHSELRDDIHPACLHVFSTIAYECLRNGEERPTMKKVVGQLQKAVDYQLAPSGSWYDVYDDLPDEDEAFYKIQTTASTASTSQSSLATSQMKNDVFLSYRRDTDRKSFVDHLYSDLQRQHIDMNEVRPLGFQCNRQELIRAVEVFKTAVIVVNKAYANSRCALDELAYIMQEKKKRGQLVIPIFHDVDPSELRRQNGRYGAAVSGDGSENAEQVESWRKAMVDLAHIPGYVVTGGNDEEDAEKIAYSITHRHLNMLSRNEATAGTIACANLIGTETRMQYLRSLLDTESDGVRMVGVNGIWGSGKSTLASSVYDEIKHEFEGCCFVKDVRSESRKHGLKTLQEKILSDVFKTKVRLKSIEQGMSIMKRRLCQKKVLIVLDDVDHFDHLQTLVGSSNWFGKGSRIIFTTRNQDLVNAHSCITHNVRMLDEEEAIELFSWNAFGACRPKEGYEELSKSIVSKFRGHPATIKNLGSFLHGKDKLEWTSALARLECIHVDEILEKVNPGDDGVSRNTFTWLLTRGGESKSAATKMLKTGFRFLNMLSEYTKIWFGKFTFVENNSQE